ncbi:phage integrase SAM-like domain-containing protein, partial [Fulvivirgaceae bacterium PWU20]|nr:phage integrase SAM-like domain-containing protein [Chryseosolibacter indicus]
MSVLFFARKSMANKLNECPIYMRITISGERFEVGTKRFVQADEWSTEASRVKGTVSSSKSINSYLDTLLSKAYAHQRQILNEGRLLCLHEFKCRWHGIPTQTPKMLMQIFDDHNNRMETLIGHEFSPLTFQRYTTAKKHTLDFLKWKLGVDDIDIKKLDYEFIQDFEFWLKSVRRCQHNTVVKYLSNFRKIVNIAIKKGWLTRDPFSGFKMSKREVEREFLTQAELRRIIEKQFEKQRMNQVRDIFLFCCYTGLAYADVQKLQTDELTIGIDGEKWIWTNRKKTGTSTRIPLLPPALKIVNEYLRNPEGPRKDKLFPVLSNHKMNDYLK